MSHFERIEHSDPVFPGGIREPSPVEVEPLRPPFPLPTELEEKLRQMGSVKTVLTSTGEESAEE